VTLSARAALAAKSRQARATGAATNGVMDDFIRRFLKQKGLKRK
jgi:hypothetical protein